MKVPESLSLTEAAGIPEAWLTAHQLLFFVSKFVAGESVLVHAAGSGVGTAAIQLVKSAGGRAIAVAGSDVKLAKAKELGADLVVDYKTKDFLQEVMAFTNGTILFRFVLLANHLFRIPYAVYCVLFS